MYSFRYGILLPSVLAGLIVTILIAFSWFTTVKNLNEEQKALALSQAKENWKKDLSFRQWASAHGGVYVKPTKRTPPNPALAHLSDRDVVTTDGQNSP